MVKSNAHQVIIFKIFWFNFVCRNKENKPTLLEYVPKNSVFPSCGTEKKNTKKHPKKQVKQSHYFTFWLVYFQRYDYGVMENEFDPVSYIFVIAYNLTFFKTGFFSGYVGGRIHTGYTGGH